jgi:hypothetical protein
VFPNESNEKELRLYDNVRLVLGSDHESRSELDFRVGVRNRFEVRVGAVCGNLVGLFMDELTHRVCLAIGCGYSSWCGHWTYRVTNFTIAIRDVIGVGERNTG